MAIYTRFGSVVTLIRPVTTAAEAAKLENRKPDAHDESRLEYGMYAVGKIEGSDEERLFDLGMLRADDGIREINDTAEAVGCHPR